MYINTRDSFLAIPGAHLVFTLCHSEAGLFKYMFDYKVSRSLYFKILVVRGCKNVVFVSVYKM